MDIGTLLTLSGRFGDTSPDDIIWGRYVQEGNKIIDWVEKYTPFQAAMDSLSCDSPVPLIVIAEKSKAMKWYDTTQNFHHMNVLLRSLQDDLGRSNEYRNRKTGRVEIKSIFILAVQSWICKSLGNICDGRNDDGIVISDWVLAALAHRLIHGRAPSLAESMLGIFARGYWPLFWRGTWPKGYAVAYCPPEFPQATNIPADCIPTQQQIDEGGGIPWIKGQRKAKPPKPPAIPMPPVIAVVPNTAWKEFTGPAFNAERIVAHLAAMFPGQPAGTGATLADIPEPSRRYLVELGQRLTGAVVVREPCDDSNPPEAVLRLLFLPQDGKASREPIRLDCRGPYIGGLKGLPASIGQVLRIHNGMALHGGFGDPAWHVYDGKQFVMEWDVWHQANPDDPEDPFPTPPQVPLTDGQDIYLLHPRHRRPDGEPTLHAMSHESGRLDDRDLGSAIARFFSLVHLVVVGRDENTGQ